MRPGRVLEPLDVLAQRALQMLLLEDEQVIRALAAQGADHALGVGVAPRDHAG